MRRRHRSPLHSQLFGKCNRCKTYGLYWGLEKIAEHEGCKEHWDGNIELGVGPVMMVMWIVCTLN